jgi:hypothetical protein
MSLGVYRGFSTKSNSERIITLDKIKVSSVQNWIGKNPMITEKYGFSGAILDNEIFTFDGKRANGSHINAAEKYNIQSDSSSTIEQTPRPLVEYACATNDSDTIWIFGGLNIYGSATSSLMSYNKTINNYTIETDMPFNAKNLVAIRISSSQILVAGQESGSLDVYYYNFINKSWTKETQSPVSLINSKAVLYNNKVFFVKNNTIFSYDTISKQWGTLTSGLINREGQFVFLIDKSIYITGGISNNNLVSETEIISLETGLIITGPEILHPRQSGFAVTNESQAFILGGHPISNKIEMFTSNATESNNQLSIVNPSKVKLDKEFTWNGTIKSANTEYDFPDYGILQITENETSGTITEKIENKTLSGL